MASPAGGLVLVDLTDSELEDFVREDIADFADHLVADTAMSLREATMRAEYELGPRLREEHRLADRSGHCRYAAVLPDGSSVGWLWITRRQPEMSANSAFLYQILVKRTRRREGHGRAMLAALEAVLAADGIEEIRLNVFDTNHRAKALYASSGYVRVETLSGRAQLAKRLHRP